MDLSDEHMTATWGWRGVGLATAFPQRPDSVTSTIHVLKVHLLLGDVDSFTAITHHDWHELRRRSSQDRRNGKFDLMLFFDDEPASQRRITSLLE